MKINVLTLFPRYFETFCAESIVAKAIESGKIEINVVNFRDFSEYRHQKVDDYVYGGGPGMLLQVQPVVAALEKTTGLRIALTPQGKKFNHKIAKKLVNEPEITLLCGHYEGFDQRIIDNFIDLEISLGDFVLTGGEIPAMAVMDAIIRLKPDVINPESLQSETFDENLLDYPQYSRPSTFRGLSVPEVLISGNHQEIEKWRYEQRKKITKEKRPDLWQKYLKTQENYQKSSQKDLKNKQKFTSSADSFKKRFYSNKFKIRWAYKNGLGNSQESRNSENFSSTNNLENLQKNNNFRNSWQTTNFKRPFPKRDFRPGIFPRYYREGENSQDWSNSNKKYGAQNIQSTRNYDNFRTFQPKSTFKKYQDAGDFKSYQSFKKDKKTKDFRHLQPFKRGSKYAK
ncbi:tRNA (guanosine(37)-N1)-methyltransferase TrmD [Mycoplasma sp. 'Moose RK']|uniref:tRNA (guanosine(37)-N1)-methyltransferase TrmD n=1 Tax=Mycoplasma sp. 'Moose RK' TaxID=2780095 RepID=UPI0018C25C96|nr:tRNA (guanosine(37)-N1)-methyltransferase TrmD [Mycoplasma sp. 'Moose RK']